MTAESPVTIDPEVNAQELDALLAEIEAATLTKRDKGTRFETLIKDWLTKDPTYSDLFTKVQTFKEWAREHSDLVPNARDIGVDLVGTNADDGMFSAIQCKFYSRDAKVAKSEVDSFVAASGTNFFTKRFLVATNESWSSNVETQLNQLAVPVTLIPRQLLAASRIDWNAYRSFGKVVMQAKREPRPYQKEAIKAVEAGFKKNNRGKLIMACGTGKTFTSMKISESLVGEGGFMMFLVPSLALLSQTLTDWKQQCAFPIHAFAVCSDASTGKMDNEDVSSLTARSELAYPATTDAKSLAEKVKEALQRPGMTVIFSTYQSIGVVSEAQKSYGLPELKLIICDEAHRTAGGHHIDDPDAPFQRIHDDGFIKGEKRLYMTATPKIYGGKAKEQQVDGEAVLYSMDDESIFGPTFYTISFSQAVLNKCLVDYKVIVLTVEETVLQEHDKLDEYEAMAQGGLSVKNAAKVIGCWRALSKLDLQKDSSIADDLHMMKRAVGFAQVIDPDMEIPDKTSSKAFTNAFQQTVEEFRDKNFRDLHDKDPSYTREEYDKAYPLSCECRHIDGTMNATEKGELLSWLREEPAENVCKILFNVRCLSEGVDVPSLDAVVFLSPRKSQVDVVQTVGRVMRTAPGKQRGYVILPIVTPAGFEPASTINNCDDFETVWQVLNALKSINSDFGALVDGQRKIIDNDKIEVVCLTTNQINRKPKQAGGQGGGRQSGGGKSGRRRKKLTPQEEAQKREMEASLFQHDEILEEEIRSKIVKRVGNRREWGDWAESVGEICRAQIEQIRKTLDDPKNTASIAAFKEFRKEIQATLNGDMTDDEIIEMLGQHVVTKPILDALFTVTDEQGNVIYSFTERNPIAKAMTQMVDALDKDCMRVALRALDDFYKSVKLRTRLFKTAEDRQVLIKELFEKFFKVAFPKQQEKLGIVYTPIEIVDFINKSVTDILKKDVQHRPLRGGRAHSRSLHRDRDLPRAHDADRRHSHRKAPRQVRSRPPRKRDRATRLLRRVDES